jgi:hypothetical protein
MSVLAVIPSWANTTSVEALPESGCLPRPSPAQVVYVKDEPGEAIFRDPVAGLLLPTKVRVSTQDVQNVFTGSDVNPVAGQEVQGISVLIQLTKSGARVRRPKRRHHCLSVRSLHTSC